ncbi:hypothetical protein ACWIUD_09115 [Helicobacter sp. 23-1044]
MELDSAKFGVRFCVFRGEILQTNFPLPCGGGLGGGLYLVADSAKFGFFILDSAIFVRFAESHTKRRI